jgi:hypothetical protein
MLYGTSTMVKMSVLIIIHVYLVSQLAVEPQHALVYLYCDKVKTEHGGSSGNASYLYVGGAHLEPR